MALNYKLLEGERCSRCGTFPDEWLDENGRPPDPPPWETTLHRCHGCAEIERSNEELDKQRKSVAGIDSGPALDTRGITVRFKKPTPDDEEDD